MKKFLALSIVLLCFIPSLTYAQVNAVLSGTASDASGALIPGVEVTAKNINTGITDTRLTNEAGNFVFPSLQPGTYTLSAALSGFQTASYNNVVLGQGQQVRLNFTLQVAAAQPHRRGLHAVLREHGRGVGRQAGDDQSQIVLRCLSDPGIGGGESVSKRKIQIASSPNMAPLTCHARSAVDH